MEHDALECAKKLGIAIVADGNVTTAMQSAIMTSGPIELMPVKEAIAAGILSALNGEDRRVWLSMLAGVLNANSTISNQHWYCDDSGLLDYHNLIDDQPDKCQHCCGAGRHAAYKDGCQLCGTQINE